jgi:hypothetical protein
LTLFECCCSSARNASKRDCAASLLWFRVDSRFARLVVSERFWFSRGVKALAESEMLGWVVVGLERRDVWREGVCRRWCRSCVLYILLAS